jgi:hypothetical protein
MEKLRLCPKAVVLPQISHFAIDLRPFLSRKISLMQAILPQDGIASQGLSQIFGGSGR